MARREPEPSPAEVEQRFAEIVDDMFRPELDRSNDAWTALGERCSDLDDHRSR